MQLRRFAFWAMGLTFVFHSACTPAPSSEVKVTDVEHTPVREQAIANCWLYASTAWLESLHLAKTGNSVNLSESYWLYWYFYDQLLAGATEDSFTDTGWFHVWTDLAQKHGYMFEEEFIADERDEPMSRRQKQAFAVLKESIASGDLAGGERTEEIVKRELDRAFGVVMGDVYPGRHDIASLKITSEDSRNFKDLVDFSSQDVWLMVPYIQRPTARPGLEEGSEYMEQMWNQYHSTHRSVMRAVNDGQPVILTFNVNFDALDRQQWMFRGANVPEDAKWVGSHLVVLEDYTVTDVPDIGDLGEGNMSDEMKEKALTGKLKYLKAKNSWGTGNGSDGYLRIDVDYLDAMRETQDGFAIGGGLSFILPATYLDFYGTGDGALGP